MCEFAPVDARVIEALLLGACPEQADELAKFWQQFEPKFSIKRDSKGLAISARMNKVTWMYKTFAHDWVVTFAGFKSLAAYGPHVSMQATTGEIAFQSLNEDIGLIRAEEELDNLLYFAKQIRQIDDLGDLEWPADIPSPRLARESLISVEDQACFDLACLAAAATFLHELRHVQFSAEKNAPPLKPEEELQCDEFSRKMLLDEVAEYCRKSGENTVRVTSKRVIGIACAALSIAEAEALGMAGAIEDSHPPIKDRFIHLVMQAEVPNEANCWAYIACLLISLLRRNRRLPDRVNFTSMKDLCGKLTECL